MQKLAAEAWLELLAAVVVVDAVGEPDAFQIDDEGLPIGIVLGAVIMGVDVLQHLSQLQPVSAVLVPENVAAQE